MSVEKKYTAQDIEILTGINRKQIYEYDLLGIVKPVEVDENNNYKYYDEETMKKFGLISLLVELGDTPRVLQSKFKNKDLFIDNEIDDVLKRANEQIKQLEEVKDTAEVLKSTGRLVNEIKKKKVI